MKDKKFFMLIKELYAKVKGIFFRVPPFSFVMRALWRRKRKVVREESINKAEKYFEDIREYVSQFDPIKVLAQISLTFFFCPEEQMEGKKEEFSKWHVWMELLCGLLLTKKREDEYPKEFDGEKLQVLEELLEKYFLDIRGGLMFSDPNPQEEASIVSLHAKMHSLDVRGEHYPAKYRDLALTLYGEHDKWFLSNLGFTIKDCVDFFYVIKSIMEDSMNEERSKSKEEAEAIIKDAQRDSLGEEEVAYLACGLYFGRADEILSFTEQELIERTEGKNDKCKKFLERMGQECGYTNSRFPNTYTSAHEAPWDYNTLYEKPIVKYGDRYFIPVFAVIPAVIMNTFNYDLLADSSYQGKYSELKGKWLEKRTAKAFKRLFAEEEVALNPCYPNGDEFCDVLVLKDRKIFIVQCKTKPFTYMSKIGGSIETIMNDLTKGVVDSFEQAKRARDYLKNSRQPSIMIEGKTKVIDKRQVTDIFMVSVTVDHFQDLITRLANVDSKYKLFNKKEYPWAVSVADLEVITEILEWPSQFIHYARRRVEVEKTSFELLCDELDLFNYYLDTNLDLERDFNKADLVSLSGLAEGVDTYMFERYELGKPSLKPRQKMSKKFREYIEAIEGLDVPYKTDCAIKLLDFGSEGREDIVNIFEEVKDKTKKDNKIHCATALFKEGDFGISFVSMRANKDKVKLFNQISSYCLFNKQKEKKTEWIGFGWDKDTGGVISTAFFASYEWVDDPALEELANKKLTNRTFRKMGESDL
jgi:hypothetical protein